MTALFVRNLYKVSTYTLPVPVSTLCAWSYSARRHKHDSDHALLIPLRTYRTCTLQLDPRILSNYPYQLPPSREILLLVLKLLLINLALSVTLFKNIQR